MDTYHLKSNELNFIFELAKKGHIEKDLFLEYLKDKNSYIQEKAADYLWKIGVKWAIAPVGHLLSISYEEIDHGSIITHLRNFFSTQAVSWLSLGLKDEDWDTQERTRLFLLGIIGEKADEYLYDYYDDERKWDEEYKLFSNWWNSVYQQYNKEVCYYKGQLFSIEEWIENLGSAYEESYMEHCLEIIENWTGVNLGNETTPLIAEKWRDWWRENKSHFEPGKNYFYGREVQENMVTEEGTRLMSLYKNKKAVLEQLYLEIQKGDFQKHKEIIPFLKDEFHEIRLYAIDLLSEIGSKSAIEPLTLLLNDLNSDIRSKVYIALTEIALARDVVPYILNGLKDENRYIVGIVHDFITNVIDEDTKPDSDDYEKWLNWWQEQSLKYKPATYYYKGKPVSIKYFINKMKVDSVTAYYLEILLTWTGQNFGDEKTPDILLKWEHWWEENKDRFEPGKRYFYGHLVP